jgi:hypothetical protein
MQTRRRLQVIIALLFIVALVLSFLAESRAQPPGPNEPAVNAGSARGIVYPKTVSGTISSATTTTIATPSTGRSIVVWGFYLAGDGTVLPIVKSSTLQIFAPVPLAQGTGLFPPVKNIATDTAYFRTWPGQALAITTDTAGPLYYWFKYTEE